MCMITERKKVKEMFIKLLQTIHNQKYLNMSGNTNISNLKKSLVQKDYFLTFK